MRRLLPLAILAFALASCEKDDVVDNGGGNNVTTPADLPNLPETPYNYANLNLPNYLLNGPVDAADNTPNNNPVTNDGATLGRVLFYDVNLSHNKTVACGSCHAPSKGFSDDLAFSVGFEGGLTGRHSMGLANAAYYANGRFFWDERAATLEDQVLQPIQDPVEMGMTLDSVVARVSAAASYPELFENAFGDNQVTEDRISRALAQFVRSMVSYQTPFDVGRAQVANLNDPFPNFSALENQGKGIFFGGRGGCAPCHGTEAFIAPTARNNGLDLNTSVDQGLGDVTGNPADNGKFKVNSLKNIAVTAPYMHDGRFATLEEVIDHYSTGVQDHPNLDPALRVGGNGAPNNRNFNQNEKNALIAFLNTLTDQAMMDDDKYADPFVE